jgi:3-oxoacyl-[acyl-carrier protein] reductase
MVLKNKIVLVTGGSSGIGQAIANSLHESGCQVIITYNTHKPNNSKFTELQVDFNSEESTEKLFAQIKKKFGKIDILVNSAGVNTAGKPFDLEVWKKVFQIDLFALISITGKAVEMMKDGGKIINISSVYAEGKAAWKEVSAYAAAKAAVSNYTQTLAKNLAPKILVNAIAPGYVRTPIWDKYTQDIIEESKTEPLIKRFIEPEEIASIALELIRNDAITGEIIVIDGGLSLKSN